MDEVAFLQSLFASEMQSAVTSSSLLPTPLPSCGRVKALVAEHTPPNSSNSSSLVPPPPNSLLGGGITLSQLQAPFHPSTSEDAPLFVRLNEDDIFNQMLNDQDFPDFPHGNCNSNSLKKEHESVVKPPTSTNSLLLEPLDLPKSNEDQSVKDTFCNDSSTFQQSLRGMRCGSLSATLNNVNGFTSEGNMMPVFPLGPNAPVYYGVGGFSNFPSTPLSWMQEEQVGVSTPGNANFPRAHSMKHMLTMAGVGMMHQQTSPGSVEMFNSVAMSSHYLSTPELWTSASRTSSPAPSSTEERTMMKQSLDAIKTLVECPSFSSAISPPASLTDKALKELIVSADFGTLPMASRPKRPRMFENERDTDYTKTKVPRMASPSPVSQLVCTSKATSRTTKGKKCVEAGCTRRAQSNSRCKAHGGGARCQYAGPGGCTRSSQGGGFCRAHGGGKRCEFPGCTRGQQRKGRCYVHGGIRKCQYSTCEKKDRGNGFCISHGGGKRCAHPNCSRSIRRGLLCQIHEPQNTLEK